MILALRGVSRYYTAGIDEINRLASDLAHNYKDVVDPRAQLRTIRILADLCAEYDEAVETCTNLAAKIPA